MPSRERLFIPIADGVRLNATLWFPDGDGSWPAVLEALPYRKDDLTASSRPEYARLAEAGYVVCRVDLRGTGTSEGVAEDEYPAVERSDMATVIGWLATREWSTGAVGMYGTSYSGFNSIQVAMERPPALKAIVPIYATDDRYGDDVHYFGGALKQLDLVDYPTYMIAMNALPPVPCIFGDGWREEWERRVEATEPWLIAWLEHQRYDRYWKFGSLCEDYGAIEAATMIVAGWADGYTNNSLRAIEQLRCPKRLILGPWAHSPTETSVPGPNIDLVPEMVRWWDRWLKGIDNGVDREPQIVLFARRSTKIAAQTEEIRGEWRFEPTWPLERTAPRVMELAGARGPHGQGPDELAVSGDVGWTGWISCAAYLPYGQPGDQRPDEPRSLVYDWGPLEEELEILGHPVLEVAVSSSAPIACLSAKLCDVFPDGYSSLVTRGLLNLTHRDSREEPSPLEPGLPYRVRLELEVTSWIFEPGHRIRLDIAGTDWPNAWPPPEPLTLTVERVRGALLLPVPEGPPPVTERPSLHAASAPTPVDRREGGDVTWRVEHDVLAGETRAVVGLSIDHTAHEDTPAFVERYAGTVGVSTGDPGRAWADGGSRFEIRWPEATAASEARTRIESDRERYLIEIELRVSEDGKERWARRWSRAIPRDHQ
ncbi:MAG: CocE/NonD family hydrolase [Actinobacteria bacterium]|nr:CocE/NonD family hydrolase [Actinomycetota bacterium]